MSTASTEKYDKNEGVTVMTRAESRNNTNYFGEPLSPEPRPAAPPAPVAPVHQIGNPTPLGMLAYGTVFLCSSLLTLGAGGVTTPNLVLLFATFYGGISQTLVGMWELYLGALLLKTYIRRGRILREWGGHGGVHTRHRNLLGDLVPHHWSVLLRHDGSIGALRTTAPIIWTLGMTVISLGCLSANCFHPNPHVNTAGGAFGLAATAGAYYGALSGFYSRESTFEVIRLPPVVVAYSDPRSA
ncbi:predicted protein [Postia placenta Mad-698-R]|nr:predicted protein [Postia placenta Mad-698-R]